MYLSSQSSVLAVILNQAIHQRALNPYQRPISGKVETNLPFVTIKAFSFVISFNSLCLLYFHLFYIGFNYFHQFSFEVILKYPSYVYHLVAQFYCTYFYSLNYVSKDHLLTTHTYNDIYHSLLCISVIKSEHIYQVR